MMPKTSEQETEHQKKIDACLTLNSPKSFFLFAGAGTGKTRTVVNALSTLQNRYGTTFRHLGKKVAVITYTNAACDEILHRIDFDPIFVVSTIHSFSWAQIRMYSKEISAVLRGRVSKEIAELQTKQKTGKTESKASRERDIQIQAKQNRLQLLDTVKQFTYNPTGENVGKNSLNHSEVIAIFTAFLAHKPLFCQIFLQKYPVLLVDESQDTQKDLIDALLVLQRGNSDRFSLGLFGDGMQRIYADGKIGLKESIPDNWETPVIDVNHRCPKRVVNLLNKIRSMDDGAQQNPRSDATEGIVRLFLIDDLVHSNKKSVEENVISKMAEFTSDSEWTQPNAIKVLTLEHHMAALRGGFDRFFDPLYKIAEFKTGLLDGTLNGVAFLAKQVLPLVEAIQSNERVEVARTLKHYSPLLSPATLSASTSSLENLRSAKMSVETLQTLWTNSTDPIIVDIISMIDQAGIFEIPEVFVPILFCDNNMADHTESIRSREEYDRNPQVDAWREALAVPFSQLQAYVEYISGKSTFGTHQGIKGLQFPRVMVILDDKEARGFMFSYEKLLGAKTLSNTDRRNQIERKESTIDRTRRLFYTTCSRAQKSLAVVVYTTEVIKVAEHVTRIGWFADEEVVRI